MTKLFTGLLLSGILFISCASHQRSNIKAEEEFVVELKRPASRGGMVETALEGLFLGAKYLADKTAESLVSSYNKSISINDYYNSFSGDIEKTYNAIHIKKYGKPSQAEKRSEIEEFLNEDLKSLPNTRGAAATFSPDVVIRTDKEDLLNFHAVIELVSAPNNPGVTRLSFNELRVFFSRTRVFKDENLNARVSIAIEGQWRGLDGTPKQAVLIEQEYDFKNLKYGPENQIVEPILSPWYYDIPINPDIDENESYGMLKVHVQLEEYEGNKSNYLNKLPSILSDNKDAIINDGASTIEKIVR